jgi:hypothetical protein
MTAHKDADIPHFLKKIVTNWPTPLFPVETFKLELRHDLNYNLSYDFMKCDLAKNELTKCDLIKFNFIKYYFYHGPIKMIS